MKICPVGAEVFHAAGRRDGGTDRQTAKNRYAQFCERA